MNDASLPPRIEPTPETSSRFLFSRKFLCIVALAFLAYANISVFFGFYDHLRTLPIDPSDYGVLIGALAAASLLVRPVISPFFHLGNARQFLFLGTVLSVTSLVAYSLADDFWSMFIVRILHGLSFAVVSAALMTLIVEIIPKERSAQFFGYIAVVTLIPNTLIPPILPFLKSRLDGFNEILLLFAGLTLLMFPLVWAVGGKAADDGKTTVPEGLSLGDILSDLKDGSVIRLLVSMLMLYCGHALIFFFLDGYGNAIGIVHAGVFLTLSTVGEIGVRVVAGAVFDRMGKARLTAWSLAGLCICYIVLAHVSGKGMFFAVGLLFGIGWGIAMPVFNGLMFDVSEPRFRAFNINLGLQMFQAGFFLGPIIGAPLLAEWGYPAIYQFGAIMSLAAVGLMLVKGKR